MSPDSRAKHTYFAQHYKHADEVTNTIMSHKDRDCLHKALSSYISVLKRFAKLVLSEIVLLLIMLD